MSSFLENSPNSTQINAINKKNAQTVSKNYDFSEIHNICEYYSPLKKYSSGLISSRLNNDILQENEENYQSAKIIHEKYDFEDINLQMNRSGLDITYSNSQRYYSGILPLNQTIDPKLKLYNIQESMRDEYKQMEGDESSNQFMNSINKGDYSFSSQLPKSVPKQITLPLNNILDYEENSLPEELSKIENQVQLTKGNSSYQTKGRPSQFQNEIKSDRKNSKLQTENFYNALQKIAKSEANSGICDSQGIQNNTQYESNRNQCATSQTPFEKQDSYSRQKSNKINITQLKKKEEQMREQLAQRLNQFQKFFRNIKNLSQAYKYRLMTLEQKQKFNDLSFHQSKKKQLLMSIDGQRVCQRFIQKWFSKMANSIPVFNPLHFAIISLEMIVFMILMSQIFFLPLTDSFRVDTFQSGIFQILFYTIPSAVLTFSIIIKFNTGYFKDNVIVKDRKKIFLQFYNTGLIIEVLSVFAVIINQVTDNSYVYFFFLLRLNLVGNSLSKIDTRFSLTQRFPHFFQIIKLIFLALLLAHINGCIFNYVARDLSTSWLTEKNLSHSEWYIRYLNSVYFSFITMVTVGYGDITPISIQEKLFVIGMTVYSCGAFGYIVSSIGNIFTEIAQKQANYNEQILINATLKMKELTFGPGQVIFNQNDCDNRIFYILKGEVQLNNINYRLCIKDEIDNCFGINEFFSGEARTYSAKSKTVTQIVYLDMTEFKSILKEDPIEYEKFCYIREQVISSKLISDQGCFFCKQYNHIYELCPFYTLKSQKQLIIEKSKLSFHQVRKEHERPKRDKFKCILENSEVRVNLKAIRLNYINNQIIDKETMIQLIETTLNQERDIDFYRNYEAFELRQKEDGQSYQAHLIGHDRVAEEYFNIEDDETNEIGSEIQDSPLTIPSSTNAKKINRTSILGGLLSTPSQPDVIQESPQRVSSASSLALTHYLQRKNSINSQIGSTLNAISQNSSYNNNNSGNNNNMNNPQSNQQNDRYSLFKQSSFQNVNQRTSLKQSTTNEPRLSNQGGGISINNIGSQYKIQEESMIKNAIQQMFKAHLKQDTNYESDGHSIKKLFGFFEIDNFDEMKEYSKYFPKFNFSSVIQSYAKSNLKRPKGIFKKRRRSAQKFSAQFSPDQKKRSRMPLSSQQHQSQSIDQGISKYLKSPTQQKQDLLKTNSQIQLLQSQKAQSINLNLKPRISDLNAESFISSARYSESPKQSQFKNKQS